MLRCRLFVLVLSAGTLVTPTSTAQAQKKTLDTLTSQDVQERLAEYMKDHPPLPWLTDRAILNPRAITWIRTPPTVRWILQPIRPTLNPGEETALKVDVKGILMDAVGNYKGGLLSSGFNAVNFDVTLAGEAPPPGEIDEDAIRLRAAEFLAQKSPYVRLLGQFVVLDPEGIVYGRTRKPGALTWTVSTRSDISGYESLIKSNVHDLLMQILGSYKGGLFSAQDMSKVQPLLDVRLRITPKSSDKSSSGKSAGSGSGSGSGTAPAPSCPVTIFPQAQPAPASDPSQRRMPSADATEPAPRQREAPPGDTGAEGPGASEQFHCGHACYWEGKPQLALVHLHEVIRLDREDARFWYYKGLAEMKLNQRTEALQSFETALDLHRQGKPGNAVITESLERVEGPMRAWLDKALEWTRLPGRERIARK